MHTNAELELSLEDLLQIALGTESLTGVNTIVLHSLLDLVLKKLGCENEKISISGYEAMVIDKLLKESSISPLVFDSIQMKTVNQFDCLSQLERTVDELEEKIDKHLEEVRNDEPTRSSNDSFPNLPILSKEHICSTCDPAMKDICNLFADSKFKQSIFEKTILPVYKRLQAMSKKLEDFEIEFVTWLEFMEQYLENISQKDTVVIRILEVDDELTKYRDHFMRTMEDLQDILDTKVDRCDVFSLEIVVDQRVDDIRRTIREYIAKIKKANTTVFALESHTSEPKKYEKSPNTIGIDPMCGCQSDAQYNSRLKTPQEMRIDYESMKSKHSHAIRRNY
uniref:RNA-binding protein AU-1 n=1 Tax=Zeugodacus cucurbitae TaxID=28588 RepID=A0A0A1XJD0_ZEUCU